MASPASIVLVFALAILSLGVNEAKAYTVTDVDILQFAFNLECLEAEFYSWAAFGVGLNQTMRGPGSPSSVGGQKALLSPYAQALAEDIATDEIAHVALLMGALKAAKHPVACPMIDVGPAFAAAANAAFGEKLPVNFSPYADDVLFYHGAFIFEDVGVTAYHGAAPLIKDKDYLSVAAGILAAEAYHAGAIRRELTAIEDQYVFPYGVTVSTIVHAISALRAAVGGGNDADLSMLVPSPPDAVAYSRTPAQVLPIVYLGGAHKGGFFPMGLNGYFS